MPTEYWINFEGAEQWRGPPVTAKSTSAPHHPDHLNWAPRPPACTPTRVSALS